ncbi:hypothetical protein MMC09_006258 [Bachmanniomyces sp. S44760]|nr:hypothetical protein [Bachmanniomyces sp. S44760]
MPHTSHKKKKKQKEYQSQKRVQLVDSDGWTHVVKGPHGIRAKEESIDWPTELQPTEIPQGLTVEDVRARCAEYQTRWEASEGCQTLVNLVENTVLPLEHLQIDTCVCTGLGSFTGAAGSQASMISNGSYITARMRESLYQLAMLTTVLDVLKKKKNHGILNVYLQDPVFNALDHSYLSSRGFIVLKHPHIFCKITSSTFLFAPYNEPSVLHAALSAAVPPLYIGNNLEVYLDG